MKNIKLIGAGVLSIFLLSGCSIFGTENISEEYTQKLKEELREEIKQELLEEQKQQDNNSSEEIVGNEENQNSEQQDLNQNSANNDSSSNNDQNIEGNEDVKPYNQELAKVFSYNNGDSYNYIGIVEYYHSEKVVSADKTNQNKELIVTLEGEVEDMSGMSEPTFKRKWIINSDVVIEKIVESNVHNDYPFTIIPNRVSLRTPLEVGTHWNQPFTHNGVEYVAESKITSIKNVTINGNEEKEITVTTGVLGIEGYEGNTYIETNTYQTGLGLVKHTHSLKNIPDMDFMYNLQ